MMEQHNEVRAERVRLPPLPPSPAGVQAHNLRDLKIKLFEQPAAKPAAISLRTAKDGTDKLSHDVGRGSSTLPAVPRRCEALSKLIKYIFNSF